MFWHLGIEAKVALSNPMRLLLRQHVIFTTDGRSPLGDKEKMHALRRRFCRSWWNDRWRDMLLAFTSAVGGSDGIRLGVGDDDRIVLGSPLQLTSLVSSGDAAESAQADVDFDYLADDDLVEAGLLDEEDEDRIGGEVPPT
jgi:hypothetical protein